MDLTETVRASFDRCCAGSDDFAATFYEIFFTKSPEIPVLFKDTDFTQQKRHFRAAVLLLIKYQPGDEPTRKALEKIGGTHRRSQLNIRPDLYPFFLESVCEALARHDPEMTPELEDQWKECVGEGVGLVISMYES